MLEHKTLRSIAQSPTSMQGFHSILTPRSERETHIELNGFGKIIPLLGNIPFQTINL